MQNNHPLRVSIIAVSAATACSSYASVQAVTETVKGRAPTAADLKIQNNTAPGLNPAQGDALEGIFTFNDLDGDQMNLPGVIWHQSEGGSIPGSDKGVIFVPGSAQLDSTLRFSAQPTTDINITDPSRAAEMVLSAPTAAPVLPSRAEFNSLYHFSSGANMRWGDAYMYCANRNERLMSVAELQELFVNYTRATTAPATENNRDLNETYGVGLSTVAWSNEGNDTSHGYIYLHENGRYASNLNESTYEVVCAKFGQPELLPSVSNVTIQGEQKVGSTLTVNYVYSGNSTIPDRVPVRPDAVSWFRSGNTTSDGPGIPGASGTQYTLTPEDVGQYITAKVYAVSYDTVVGNNAKGKTGQIQPAVQPFPQGTTLEANGYDFAIDSGFPTTGFHQAKFQVQIGGTTANNGNYTWSTDQSWASVDSNGHVTFTGTASGSNKSVEIQARTGDTIYSKTITLSQWFVTASAQIMQWSDANFYCNNYSGNYSLGTTEQLSGTAAGNDDNNYNDGVRGVLGGLWSEWGEMNLYYGSGFIRDYFYTSEKTNWTGKSEHKMTSLYSGDNSRSTDTVLQAVVCRTSL
ncbi:hypothetical protein RVW00_004721 [Enterobacter bugandensis]|nr:hypothetical protein [Enterobacter bugandensis]